MVFDCDGVLVDSEPLAWRAWKDVLSKYGVDVTDHDVASLTGHGEHDVYATFARRGPLPRESEIITAVREATLVSFRARLRPFDDALAAVAAVRAAAVPVAVATSSPRSRLDVSLQAVGLEGTFAGTVAGDEVVHAKPAPDLYLAAATSLGVDPQRSVAVENTAAGIESAHAAGMRVVAVVRDHGDSRTLADADLVVTEITPDVLLDQLR